MDFLAGFLQQVLVKDGEDSFLQPIFAPTIESSALDAVAIEKIAFEHGTLFLTAPGSSDLCLQHKASRSVDGEDFSSEDL